MEYVACCLWQWLLQLQSLLAWQPALASLHQQQDVAVRLRACAGVVKPAWLSPCCRWQEVKAASARRLLRARQAVDSTSSLKKQEQQENAWGTR